MPEDRPLVHNAYVGLAVVTIAVTPAWLLVLYQVATPAERKDFWGWYLWPALIPLIVGAVFFVALIRGWPLPGLKRSDPPPSVPEPVQEPPPLQTRGLVMEDVGSAHLEDYYTNAARGKLHSTGQPAAIVPDRGT